MLTLSTIGIIIFLLASIGIFIARVIIPLYFSFQDFKHRKNQFGDKQVFFDDKRPDAVILKAMDFSNIESPDELPFRRGAVSKIWEYTDVAKHIFYLSNRRKDRLNAIYLKQRNKT